MGRTQREEKRWQRDRFLLREFIIAVTAVLCFITASGERGIAEDVILQDGKVLVAFDRNSGALTRLEDKANHWIVERRPELAISFRLHAPLPNRRDNFVLGSRQKASEVSKVGENKVILKWKDLLSEHGGTLPITFSASVTLEDGALRFEGKLINNSKLTVETLEYPYLGDLTPPSPDTPMQARAMWYDNLESSPIYPTFRNEKGYWGIFYPTKVFESYRSLFCLIQTPGQGLYVQMGDASQRYLLEYTFEQHPGLLDSADDRVPLPDQIDGRPVHLIFRATHFLFVRPHSTSTLAPVILQAYGGDWHSGVDIYKRWRATWFRQSHVPEWVTDIHSWLQLQINSPEQDYRVPYVELPKYAEECARNGVKAIQLVGWNRGGQDGGDPAQDTDPGLGTWQQLHDAIAQIQAMGVKVILFGKLNWADKTTSWYKNELFKYASTDPYGIEYEQGGYSYFTPTQLAAINNHRRAVMDFMDPAYRQIASKEFEKILRLGASGWLFDENCHHGPVKYSFAGDHGYQAPGFIYGGDMPMGSELRSAADIIDKDFLFAGEGHQDWLEQYYPLAYFRIDNNSTPVERYIDPHAPLIVAVTGFDDREKLNLILLDRYIISYEPYNFKGHVTDFSMTLEYGKKIDELRRRYKAWLWDAEFRDTLGAKVTANGATRYSVFLTHSGKRAVVIVNQEPEKTIEAHLDLPNAGHLLVATPEQPDARLSTTNLDIPARSAVIVLEQ